MQLVSNAETVFKQAIGRERMSEPRAAEQVNASERVIAIHGKRGIGNDNIHAVEVRVVNANDVVVRESRGVSGKGRENENGDSCEIVESEGWGFHKREPGKKQAA